MRRMHRDALNRWTSAIDATGGSGIQRNAKVKNAEDVLNQISAMKTSVVIAKLIDMLLTKRAPGGPKGMIDLFDFLFERTCAELDLRVQVPAVEPE